MSIETIKQQINENNDSLELKMNDFEVRRSAIVEQLKPFVQNELKRIVENEVKRNSEQTKTLGAERLGEMKKQLLNLLECSHNLVDTVFENDNLWVHVNYTIVPHGDSWGQKHNNTKRAETCIISGIKKVLGKAGKILIDFGYAKAGSKYERTSQWQIDDDNEVVFGSNYGFQIPVDIEKAIADYCKQIEEIHNIIDKLEKLKKELSEQEAFDLWEQV